MQHPVKEAYEPCEIYIIRREISQRVGRNQATGMRIMSLLDAGINHEPIRLITTTSLTTAHDDRRTVIITHNGNALCLLTNPASACFHHDDRIRVSRHCGERSLNCMHRYTDPASDIMGWSGIGFHSLIPLVRIAGTLNSQHYIYEVLEPVVYPYIHNLLPAIFQQENA
ncbi:transposable element Tcb1 transposase [Trichonephila clavipes]|nr:transposable element Tcb1 transposase [Trichonephila clavipes]